MENQMVKSRKIKKVVKKSVTGIKNMVSIATNITIKPDRIVFMVTDKCNSRCSHCNIWSNESSPNPLSPKELEKTLSDELFSNVEYVICTGGEPSVRRDLKELILSIHRALPNSIIQLSTNGLLPDRIIEVAKTAIEKKFRLDIGISLDGIGEEHDKIRGVKGNFEKSDRLFHELAKLRDAHSDILRVDAGIVISELTLQSLESVRHYTKNLNIGLTEAWYNESSFYDNVGEKEISADLTHAVESQPESPLKDLWLKKLNGKSCHFRCYAMNTFCVLKCNGDIVPCLNMFSTSAGNVRDKSPSLIWNSEEMRKVRDVVKNCEGCLNSWGAGWSLSSSFYPVLLHYLRNPKRAFKSWQK